MHSKLGQIGIASFFIGIIAMVLMIWLGVSGHRWPDWLLAITTIL